MNKSEVNAMKNAIPPNTPPMIGPTCVGEEEVFDTEVSCDGVRDALPEIDREVSTKAELDGVSPLEAEFGWIVTLEAPLEVGVNDEGCNDIDATLLELGKAVMPGAPLEVEIDNEDTSGEAV